MTCFQGPWSFYFLLIIPLDIFRVIKSHLLFPKLYETNKDLISMYLAHALLTRLFQRWQPYLSPAHSFLSLTAERFQAARVNDSTMEHHHISQRSAEISSAPMQGNDSQLMLWRRLTRAAAPRLAMMMSALRQRNIYLWLYLGNL